MTENTGNNSNNGTVKTLSEFMENLLRNVELYNQGKLKLPERDYPESGLDMDVPGQVYLDMLRKEKEGEERQKNQGE